MPNKYKMNLTASKNRPSKMKFFLCQGIFFSILKMDVKMNLRIVTKNHTEDSKKGCPLKIDFRADWTHESLPAALELILENFR